MSTSLKALGVALLSMACLGAAHAAPTVIDFDEPGIALGDTITNQYAGLGLMFSGANNVVRNADDLPPGSIWAVDPPAAPVGSSPSFVFGHGNTLEISILSGFGIGSLTFSFAASNSFEIKVVDAANASQSVFNSSQGTNNLWMYDVTVAVHDNSRIRFNAGQTAASEFAIDNIRFGSSSNHGVPEPGAMALVAVALAGLAWSRRKSA